MKLEHRRSLGIQELAVDRYLHKSGSSVVILLDGFMERVQNED